MDTFLSDSLTRFLALGGVALLVTAIVGALKQFGVIPDGNAQRVSNILNAVFFGLFIALGFFNVDISQFDPFIGTIAQLILALLGILATLKGSPAIHNAAKGKAQGVPILKWLGFSHPSPVTTDYRRDDGAVG